MGKNLKWWLLGGGALFLGAVIFGAVLMIKAWWSQPFGPFQPEGAQPIAFNHQPHVQKAQIDCQFCHRQVMEGEAATLPAVQQCYFCHKVILPDRPEISKALAAFEAGDPINWVRVHRLPDHVQFVHDAHVRFFSEQNKIAPSQVCSICHGDVGSMAIAQQVRTLKMGDCVDCHRGGYLNYLAAEAETAIRQAIVTGQRRAPPTDCATCHY